MTKNMAASVHARLSSKAEERGRPFQLSPSHEVRLDPI